MSTKASGLSLTQELMLMLLNEDTGYFHQVRGWNLNCAVVGAVLADLSLMLRIDTDMKSLYLVDSTPTGDESLDPILAEIAREPVARNAQYWIEYLAPRAGSIIDLGLDRLVELNILQHHDGDFWSLTNAVAHTGKYSDDQGNASRSIKTRIGQSIFTDAIPDPRDVIVICLANACGVMRHAFELDDAAEERIELISKMDLIGRSIASAVTHNLAGPSLRRSSVTRDIPTVPLRDLALNRHARDGNVPALFASIAKKHGPVFKIRPPLSGNGMTFLAGIDTNRWMHRSGRSVLRSKDYLEDFEKVYGASRILPSMDGADHFRMRKAIRSAYSRESLEARLDELFLHGRKYIAKWRVGDVFLAVTTLQELMNAQFSQLAVGMDTQHCFRDVIEYKERSLVTHIQHALPKFMLKTPGMRRKKKRIAELIEEIQRLHTPAQRVGCPRNIVDDFLSLHASDPQFLPETDLHFSLVSPLIVSLYLGNAISFALYELVSHPDLYARVQAEADRIFGDGDPGPEAFGRASIDVTHRFLKESQRLYPIIPIQIRTVMNPCVVKGHELPMGERIYIATTATHYMEEAFPDPYSFDIDRYQIPRREHLGFGYAPYGLGTHLCLGFRWVDLQLAANLLMMTRYFRFEVAPPGYKLRINPFPTLAPSSKLRFVVAEKRAEMSL